jgi:hypothetical protein
MWKVRASKTDKHALELSETSKATESCTELNRLTRIWVWKLSLMNITPCHTFVNRISYTDTANRFKWSQQHSNSAIGSLVGNGLNHPKWFTFYTYRAILSPCPASIFCNLFW